ncbi:hypothetical protein ACJJTC_004848 [Scirpophaga incertulas]
MASGLIQFAFVLASGIINIMPNESWWRPIWCGRVLRAIRDEHRAHCDQGGEGAGESLQRLVQATGRLDPSHTSAPAAREALRAHLGEGARRDPRQATRWQNRLAAGGRIGDGGQRRGCGRCYVARQQGGAGGPRGAGGRRATGPRGHARRHHGRRSLLRAGEYGAACRWCWVRAVLAGGALLARAGTRAVTTAAAHYCVPVIALAPLYKLSPTHACDHWHIDALAAPHHALPYGLASSDAAHAVSPRYDLVPPDHVTLFLTNLGGSSPSYIYRLLSELYDPNDNQF